MSINEKSTPFFLLEMQMRKVPTFNTLIVILYISNRVKMNMEKQNCKVFTTLYKITKRVVVDLNFNLPLSLSLHENVIINIVIQYSSLLSVVGHTLKKFILLVFTF